jgi:hypothetical protein
MWCFFICRPCDQIQATDREAIAEKIRSAFYKKTESYDDLISLCVALTESQIYNDAPSKLDYYKQGITYVKKIFDKSAELHALPVEDTNTAKPDGVASEDPAPRVVKRAKTQH